MLRRPCRDGEPDAQRYWPNVIAIAPKSGDSLDFRHRGAVGPLFVVVSPPRTLPLNVSPVVRRESFDGHAPRVGAGIMSLEDRALDFLALPHHHSILKAHLECRAHILEWILRNLTESLAGMYRGTAERL